VLSAWGFDPWGWVGASGAAAGPVSPAR
jgi:hypothetical protein